MDHRRLARQQRLDELGHHAAVGVRGVLPRPEDVRVAHRRGREVVGLVEREAVVLARELRHRVGREQREVIVLVDGQITGIAVDRGGRGVDHALDLGRARGEQDVQRAADVGLEVLARVAGRDHDVARRAVEHDLVPGHDGVDLRGIADRALHELEAGRGQVLAAAGEQVVEHGDARPLADQARDQAAADEARATGDQDAAVLQGGVHGGSRFGHDQRPRDRAQTRHARRPEAVNGR